MQEESGQIVQRVGPLDSKFKVTGQFSFPVNRR